MTLNLESDLNPGALALALPPSDRVRDAGRPVTARPMTPGPTAAAHATPPPALLPAPRPVVAVVLEWREHLLLLKRSREVAHDRGRWHCVTGYVEANCRPIQQAIDEVHEETGLRLVDLTELDEGPVLSLPDADGRDWPVHTFRALTHQRRLTLNWEHTAYRWVRPSRLGRFDGRVTWLEDVIRAVAAAPGQSTRSD